MSSQLCCRDLGVSYNERQIPLFFVLFFSFLFFYTGDIKVLLATVGNSVNKFIRCDVGKLFSFIKAYLSTAYQTYLTNISMAILLRGLKFSFTSAFLGSLFGIDLRANRCGAAPHVTTR